MGTNTGGRYECFDSDSRNAIINRQAEWIDQSSDKGEEKNQPNPKDHHTQTHTKNKPPQNSTLINN